MVCRCGKQTATDTEVTGKFKSERWNNRVPDPRRWSALKRVEKVDYHYSLLMHNYNSSHLLILLVYSNSYSFNIV